ncbi:hypothetical protein [Prauserella cavernicola]|uniref:Uncharacterized protein n=1 Tax=Prauserella cavernicola TaxID=2800127 RepID=A0A934QU69_9PSEU|nr:hypothetical protein [Prauserella cavernicola]MBK1786362.1 hypothetical protein [Prauserella cavernicola]
MTEQQRPNEDPTAEWLDSVRTEETPWRVDRPAGAEPTTTYAAEEQKLSRARRAARAVGDAAPFVGLAATAGWVATETFGDDQGEVDPGMDVDPGGAG